MKGLDTGGFRLPALFLVVSAVYLFGTTFIVPGTPIFFENDHFIQMNDSLRMLSGEVMYRDFFQFTFPGTEVWYLAAFALFGAKIWILNATIILLGLGLTSVLLAISRRVIGGAGAYLPPVLFLFFGFRWYGMDGGHRLFSCLFASLAILVLIREINVRRLLAAGALCAMSAFFTQTRGAAAVAAIGVFLIWHHWPEIKGARVGVVIRDLLVLAAGAGVTLAVALAYFLATAGIGRFFAETVGFARNYAADPVNNSDLYLRFWTGFVHGSVSWASLPTDLFYYVLVPAIYVVGICYVIVRRAAVSPDEKRNIMLLCLVGLGIFGITTGLGPDRLYHAAIPGLVVLGWIVARWIDARLIYAISIALVALSFGLTFWTQFRHREPLVDLPTGRVLFQSNVAAERYVWSVENTHPGDEVYEAYRSVINFPLLLRDPVSVPMLRNNNYTTPEQASEVLDQLSSHRPKFILWNAAWSTEPRRPEDHLEPIYLFVTNNYELRREFTPMYDTRAQVWQLKGTF